MEKILSGSLYKLTGNVKDFVNTLREIAQEFQLAETDIANAINAAEKAKDFEIKVRIATDRQRAVSDDRNVYTKLALTNAGKMIPLLKNSVYWNDNYNKALLLDKYEHLVFPAASVSIEDKEKTIADIIAWLKNFAVKLTDAGIMLCLAKADVRIVKNNIHKAIEMADRFKTCYINYMQLIDDRNNSVLNFKNSKNIIAELLKKNTSWKGEYIKELGISKVKLPAGIAGFSPQAEVKDRGTHVSIRFIKDGINAANIYTRMQGEKDFIFLAYAERSPFTDPRPVLPGIFETREYQLRAIINGHEFGLPGDVLFVKVGRTIHLKPEIKLVIRDKYAILKFLKKGLYTYGANVYCRKHGDEDFIFLDYAPGDSWKDQVQLITRVSDIREYQVRALSMAGKTASSAILFQQNLLTKGV